MSPVIFTLASTDDGEFITVYAPGRDPLPADDSHANFDAIKEACVASLTEDVDPDAVADLFDIGETVQREFQRLTERVAVVNGVITLDGDPVHGTLQEQILDFLDSGEDFGPLVNFYEKLVTNPLGDVRDGLYDWIVGQRESGTLTITPDGDVIGYKSVKVREPEWRASTDVNQAGVGVGDVVYTPSRRGPGVVNGREVASDEFIEQIDGDVVEMPRSKVLHAPSQACGDGLHIGTYGYASTFYGGETVLLVKFSPRDIVSLPDSNSTWKLRVCRYTVIGECDEPLDTPLYITEAEASATEEQASDQGLDLDLSVGFYVGDRVEDEDGDEGEVVAVDEDGSASVKFDNTAFGTVDGYESGDLTVTSRVHGKGGPTSYAAKGRGRNPAQDPATGRFVKGRPGSARDAKTGRFSG